MSGRKILFAFFSSFLFILSLHTVGTSTDVHVFNRIEKAEPVVRGQLAESFSVTGIDQAHQQFGASGEGIGVLVIDDWSTAYGIPHGDSVVSVIQAVAPGADVWSCKLDFTKSTMADFTGCFQEMKSKNLPVQIVNMSFSMGLDFYSSPCGTNLNEFGQEIHRLAQEGVIFVAAADNQGHKNGLRFPACDAEVVSVGATYDFSGGHMEFISGEFTCSDTAKLDEITCYSNMANYLDVLAPGTTVATPVNAGFGGTSASAPIVSGVIAMMLSLDSKLSAGQVTQILSNTGQPVYEKHLKMSFPRVDAFAAVSQVAPVSSGFRSTKPASAQGQLADFDRDHDLRIDDHEFFQAVDLWVQSNLSDVVFFQIIDAWTGQVAVQHAENSHSEQHFSLKLQRSRDSMLFSSSLRAEQVQLTIFDLNGSPIFESRSTGSTLRWNMLRNNGSRAAIGVYLYKFVSKIDGKAVVHTGRVAVTR